MMTSELNSLLGETFKVVGGNATSVIIAPATNNGFHDAICKTAELSRKVLAGGFRLLPCVGLTRLCVTK